MDCELNVCCVNSFRSQIYSPTQGGIQFFIDALDRDVTTSGLVETEVIINRFAINLELTLGPTFTDRVNYTGIYNISGLGFDMSFRVQCTENYYGPNCTTFCEPMEGVYTCDSEGRIVCPHDGQDLATNCSACLQGWDLQINCTSCLPYRDILSNCTQCLTGRDISTNCATCLPGYDPSTNCIECLSTDMQCQPTLTTQTVTYTSSKYTTVFMNV